MTAMHMTDAQRDLAAMIKMLLARVETGHDLDYALGADVIDALDAPRSIGNPVAQVDAALALAAWLKQDPIAVVQSVLRDKTAECSHYRLARMTCAVLMRVHLANLERAPA